MQSTSFLWLGLGCCAHLHWWQWLHQGFQIRLDVPGASRGRRRWLHEGLPQFPAPSSMVFLVPRCPVTAQRLPAAAWPAAAPGAFLQPRLWPLGMRVTRETWFSLYQSSCFLFPQCPTFFFFSFFPPLFFLWEVFQWSSGFSDALPNRPLVTPWLPLTAQRNSTLLCIVPLCLGTSTRWSYLSCHAK